MSQFSYLVSTFLSYDEKRVTFCDFFQNIFKTFNVNEVGPWDLMRTHFNITGPGVWFFRPRTR